MEFAIFTRWFVSANDHLNRKIYRNVLAPLTFHTTHFGHMNGTDRSTYRPKQSKKCEYLFTVSGICLVSLMVSIAVGVQWQSKYPLLNIVNSSAKRDTSPRVHGIFYKCDIWTNKAFLNLNDFSDLVHDFDLE